MTVGFLSLILTTKDVKKAEKGSLISPFSAFLIKLVLTSQVAKANRVPATGHSPVLRWVSVIIVGEKI